MIMIHLTSRIMDGVCSVHLDERLPKTDFRPSLHELLPCLRIQHVTCRYDTSWRVFDRRLRQIPHLDPRNVLHL